MQLVHNQCHSVAQGCTMLLCPKLGWYGLDGWKTTWVKKMVGWLGLEAGS